MIAVHSRWSPAPIVTSHGLTRAAGVARAMSPSAIGASTTRTSMSLLLQRAQPRDVGRAELAADVIDDDAHHEDRDEQVEQHADLDEERYGIEQREAHDEDAVLEDQVADDLGDRLAPRREHDEAGEHGRERAREHQRLLVGGDQRQ